MLRKSHFYSSKFDYKNRSWFNRHSKLRKILCIITVITLLMLTIMLATVAAFGYTYEKDTSSIHAFVAPLIKRFVRQVGCEDICMTKGCIRTAHKILQSLDESVDPCDNFYKFACDGWRERHTIPGDKKQISVFDNVKEKMDSQLKVLLQKKLDGTEPNHIKLVKDMFDSCMNVTNIEEAGDEPLLNVLEILGGWPVVIGEQWSESNFDWMEFLFKLRNLGYDHRILVEMSVDADLKDITKHTINLDQPNLGIPSRSYFMEGFNNSATQAYFNLMVKSAKKLGADEQRAEQELLQAFNLERTLANYSLPREERRNFNSLYHKYTIPQLRELEPQIDWIRYLNGLLDDTITESETVVVYNTDFLVKFGELIANTDKRVVANYMVWKVIADTLYLLSSDWRALEHEYKSALSGRDAQIPRWKQCLSPITHLRMDNYLLIALSSYYIKYKFRGGSNEVAKEIVRYVKNEFFKTLEEIDWMDDETKTAAREKAESITVYVGFLQELRNDTLVADFFKTLTMTTENYFNNVLNTEKWSNDYSLSLLRKPYIKGEWTRHAFAAVADAWNNIVENSIEFPAGILQDVFFNKDRPHYMNFGAFGYVIGHEVTHGFDDKGKQFDKDGNNRNWWDETTDARFKEKAQCIIYQYGNYTAENGMPVNGINTQGENIADNGGMKQAYRAYHSWVEDHSPESKLPGLTYSPSQLFWISAANVWCGKYRPKYLESMIKSDPHSPAEFRVNGPMSNIKEFAEAFECPSGSNMNPVKKCEVW